MSRDYALPLETDWTVDDLTILPARCRYELIDGRLDLWDRDSLARLAGLALMAELKAACPPGFRVVARMALERDGVECPTPDIAVLDPGDTVVLALSGDDRPPAGVRALAADLRVRRADEF